LPVFTTPKGIVGTRHVKPGEKILAFEMIRNWFLMLRMVKKLVFNAPHGKEIGF
jgi:hypothetical protein